MSKSWISIPLVYVLAACGGTADGQLPEAKRCPLELPARGRLHTHRSHFVDELGRVVRLHGVNAGGRAKFAPYTPFDFDAGIPTQYNAALQAYLDRAADWGIDVLRVPFSWQAAEPTRGTYDETYLAHYQDLLDGAWARGMWTIVDFHQDVYAEAFCGDGFPSWTLVDPPPPHHDCPQWSHAYDDDPRVRAAFDAFWDDINGDQTVYRGMYANMVDRFGARPGVIGFEPINEPHPGTNELGVWETGTLPNFYREMASQTATHAPGALTFVDTTGYEGVTGGTALTRPDGDGIVLAPHSYDALTLFGGEPDHAPDHHLVPWYELGLAWDVPVMIGELGIPVDNPAAARYADEYWNGLDEYKLGGTWWEYSTARERWNDENFSIVDATGVESPVVDMLARPYLRAVHDFGAGSQYDATTRRATFWFTEQFEGVAELAVPPRWGALRIGARGACVDERPGTVLATPDPGATDVQISIEPIE